MSFLNGGQAAAQQTVTRVPPVPPPVPTVMGLKDKKLIWNAPLTRVPVQPDKYPLATYNPQAVMNELAPIQAHRRATIVGGNI